MMADGTKTQWFLRDWTFPEEDRALFTTIPWKRGEFRWFRSPNVVCLEQWRCRQAHSQRATPTPTSPTP